MGVIAVIGIAAGVVDYFFGEIAEKAGVTNGNRFSRYRIVIPYLLWIVKWAYYSPAVAFVHVLLTLF